MSKINEEAEVKQTVAGRTKPPKPKPKAPKQRNLIKIRLRTRS